MKESHLFLKAKLTGAISFYNGKLSNIESSLIYSWSVYSSGHWCLVHDKLLSLKVMLVDGGDEMMFAMIRVDLFSVLNVDESWNARSRGCEVGRINLLSYTQSASSLGMLGTL